MLDKNRRRLNRITSYHCTSVCCDGDMFRLQTHNQVVKFIDREVWCLFDLPQFMLNSKLNILYKWVSQTSHRTPYYISLLRV